MPSICGVAEEGAGTPAAVTAAVTKAVLAACVVFVPAVAVGTVGVPVKAGDANGARLVSLGWTWSALA